MTFIDLINVNELWKLILAFQNGIKFKYWFEGTYAIEQNYNYLLYNQPNLYFTKSAIHYACLSSDSLNMRYLIENHGGDWSFKYKSLIETVLRFNSSNMELLQYLHLKINNLSKVFELGSRGNEISLDTVKYLISLNYTFKNIYFFNVSVFKYLHENNLYNIETNKDNLFNLSIRYSQIEIVKYLYENGAKFTTINIDHLSARENCVELLSYLLENKIIEVTTLRWGETDNIEFIKLCDKFNIEVFPVNIGYAAKFNKFELVKYLHSKGQQLCSQIIYYAMKRQNLELIKYCIANGELFTSTHNIAQYGTVKILKYFFELNVNGTLDDNGHDGYFVHKACQYGNLRILDYLFKVNKLKFTQKHIETALTNNHVECAKYLNSVNKILGVYTEIKKINLGYDRYHKSVYKLIKYFAKKKIKFNVNDVLDRVARKGAGYYEKSNHHRYFKTLKILFELGGTYVINEYTPIETIYDMFYLNKITKKEFNLLKQNNTKFVTKEGVKTKIIYFNYNDNQKM